MEHKVVKALVPYGFIRAFYKECWGIIKGDLMAAINYFLLQPDQHIKQVNSTHIILIPKNIDVKCVCDYNPISLTHNVVH